MEKNLNFNRTLVAMAALVIVFAGIKLAAEIVVPFLLALFIAIICSPVIKAMIFYIEWKSLQYFVYFNFNRILSPRGIN